jgi:S-(hydroxymethyl)glutathione dehydrogenase/alcohol dehydrogenase
VASTVRAAVIERPGEPLRIEELTLDDPRAGEVRVRMLASGVCHSDLHVRDGEWQRPGPLVLGHEGAGVVEAIGPGVTNPPVGALVALTWYAPCLRCRACRAGRQWLCSGSSSGRHRLPDGRTPLHRPDGSEVLAYCGIATFGDAIVVPAQAAIPMPDGTPPEVAALIGCCVATGVGAVTKTAVVEPGSSVVVIGLGGVGLSAVMGAALAGASPIVAVDRVAAKLDLARELGATAGVLATDRPATDAAIRDAIGGGPDYAVEAIGLPSTIEQAIELLPPGGTAVLVGMTPFGSRGCLDVFRLV